MWTDLRVHCALARRRRGRRRLSMLLRALAAYDGLLARHRLPTTTVSGAVLSGAGDALVQRASTEPLDEARLAAFTAFGGVLTGPINWKWLALLDRLVISVAPGGGGRGLAAKVLIQSFVFQPFVYLPTFFTANALVRRWDFASAYEHARATYAGTLGRLWLFWTPPVIVAFGYLPLRRQAVFFAGVGFAWNCVLSLYAGQRRGGQ